jgi:ATP-dependent phosphofructokinase / diphosphate-dependent phosphofructokinase
MTSKKRIGILTSGGDCAGLNAAIRAVVHRSIDTYGWEVIGIIGAIQGLMERPTPAGRSLTIPDVERLLTMGGTYLGTKNQGNPLAIVMDDGSIDDRAADIIAGYHQLGLDALIGIGGDGSLAILRNIALKGGLNFVAIPKTIDNDVGVTERSIGFDTAVNIATEALDRLHSTAASHSRVMILEVMGRNVGHIAISAGIAGGADVILIPEIPYTLANICDRISTRQAQGKNYALMIVSEAVKTEDGESVEVDADRYGGIGHYLARKIEPICGAETRVTSLGHTQRGGMPSPLDRLIASAFGVAAVDLIAAQKFDRMVAWQCGEVIDVPIAEAISHYCAVDPQSTLVKTARGLGIYLGD